MPGFTDYPILRTHIEGVMARNLVLMYPRAASMQGPESFNVHRGQWGSAAKVTWPLNQGVAVTDNLAFSHNRSATAGVVRTDAQAAFYRRIELANADEVSQFMMINGSLLFSEGARIIQSKGEPCSVMGDGITLIVEGPAITEFRAYMPGVQRVILNGREVSFTLDEHDYVYPRIGYTVVPEMDVSEKGPVETRRRDR